MAIWYYNTLVTVLMSIDRVLMRMKNMKIYRFIVSCKYAHILATSNVKFLLPFQKSSNLEQVDAKRPPSNVRFRWNKSVQIFWTFLLPHHFLFPFLTHTLESNVMLKFLKIFNIWGPLITQLYCALLMIYHWHIQLKTQ